MKRRHFLMSATATAGILASRAVWADLGRNLYLSAANRADNSTLLVGVEATGETRFILPLPGRGHAAAAHPHRAEAVAFARRPGNFATVLDCATGREIARLTTPEDRHFYGHGAFTADGRYLLTTENAFEVPDGRIGLWDAERGYARAGDLPSGGIGPHEMLRLPGGGFAVANGGIQTHPDFDRVKLNLPTMRPSLAYLSAAGELEEVIEPPADLHQNSIRHLAVDASGRVIMATQWEGPPNETVPVLATHRRGEPITFADSAATASLRNYAGSVAVSADGHLIALTGPQSDSLVLLTGETLTPASTHDLKTASGVCTIAEGFLLTAAGGLVRVTDEGPRLLAPAGSLVWDNHLIAV